MRKKIITILTIIIALVIGAGGMYFYLTNTKNGIRTVYNNKNVNITSNDSISESVNKIYDAVVVVETLKGKTAVSSGTGFIYKNEKGKGYIITNNHVIASGDNYNVILSDGQSAEAVLLGNDVYSDLAVLQIDEKYVTTVAEIGLSSDIKVGDTVFTVGAPLSDEYSGTVTKGIISGKDRMVAVTLNNSVGDYMMNVIQTDASINPGNSGGPLCNINGEVVGINSLKLVEDEVEGIGFAIPIDEAMVYIEKLEKGKSIQRPMLGVTLLNASDSYELYLSGIVLSKESPEGVVVGSVTNDSPASKAGLEKGDIITKLGDKETTSRAILRYQLYKYNIGDAVKITYYRDGKENTVEVTLDKSLQ